MHAGKRCADPDEASESTDLDLLALHVRFPAPNGPSVSIRYLHAAAGPQDRARRNRAARVWLAVTLGLLLAAPAARAWAQSESLPREVQQEIIENSAACGSREPQIDMGFLTSLDVNGDGIPDYVLNYQNFRCGDRQGFCGSRGCLLQIFVSKNGKFEKVIDEDVWSVDINRGRGRPSLVLGLHGPACEQRVDVLCKATFVWNGSKFVRTGRPRAP